MAVRIRDGLLAASCALVVVCCRNPSSGPADPSYRDAESRLQSGDLVSALKIAEEGARRSPAGTAEHWRFRLAQAVARWWQGHNPAAVTLRAPEPPAATGLDVAARRATIQALASNSLQRFDDADAYLKKAQSRATGIAPEFAIDITLADGWLGFA